MRKVIQAILILIVAASCKTISVNHENQTKTTQNIKLGIIGEQKDFVVEKDYNQTALPKYQEPVKLVISKVPFNKNTFEAYQKASMVQNSTVLVNYVDSLQPKPIYIKIEIADRLSMINSLNNVDNIKLFEFLQNKSDTHIVSTISIAFNAQIIDALDNADEVFLAHSGVNNYVLKVFKNNSEQQTILFNEGVVFGYQYSNFCWKENQKYQLKIVDIVERDDKCPSKTYRSAKRARKKINYYKF